MTLLRVRPIRVGTVVRVGLVVALTGCTAPSPVIIDLCPARITSSQLLSEARLFSHYYRFFEARDPVSGGVAGGGGRGLVVD